MKKLLLLSLAVFLGCASAVRAQQYNAGTQAWATSQVSVPTSAGGVLVASARQTRSNARIYTLGTNQVWCGPNNTISAGNGVPIQNTANSFIDIPTRADIYCIAVGSAQTVAVQETY